MRQQLKNILLLASIVSMAPNAFASGFNCTSVDQDTMIEVVFTPIHPDGSHREPRVKQMTVSDPNVTEPFRHIATFLASDGLLTNEGGSIEAIVDLRFPGSSRKGERLGGTKLGALKTITLNIDFTYTEPTSNGAHYAAEATYVKRNGEEFQQDFDCVLFMDSTLDVDLVERLNSRIH
ncbi:MAG TPA: hypothetical protein VM432_04375 [Bdellovibrionales bacterium]|nr:hypothetical protein [Bdellovibrionales bacterium]